MVEVGNGEAHRMVEARTHLESLCGSLVELSRNKIVDRREYSNRQQPATTSLLRIMKPKAWNREARVMASSLLKVTDSRGLSVMQRDV